MRAGRLDATAAATLKPQSVNGVVKGTGSEAAERAYPLENARFAASVPVPLPDGPTVLVMGREKGDRHRDLAFCQVFGRIGHGASPPSRSRLPGQRHFRLFCHSYKHDARASEFRRKLLTRLRFVLVWPTKVALSNYSLS